MTFEQISLVLNTFEQMMLKPTSTNKL